MKRRHDTSTARINEPSIPILDEPILAVSTAGTRQPHLGETELLQRRGTRSCLTTHYMDERNVYATGVIMEPEKSGSMTPERPSAPRSEIKRGDRYRRG